jgi:hypothetical protein
VIAWTDIALVAAALAYGLAMGGVMVAMDWMLDRWT